MDLGLDADELNTCVQCGLCLPFCPTYRVTGDESLSPRGRIALMREVQIHNAPVTEEVQDAFSTCVQCRGCEPACPSSVPYGHLMEATRAAMNDAGMGPPMWLRAALSTLDQPRLLAAGASVIAAGNRVGITPKRLGLPTELPLRAEPLPVTGTDVWFFTGCVMDAMQRDVHRAGIEVIEAAGFGATPTGDKAPCCGALHVHSGLAAKAASLAESVIDALDDDRPIIIDSAGCGAQLKDYGHLLGTARAKAFSERVFDICEWLAPHTATVANRASGSMLDLRVAIQDPCHLRHVQRVHEATRTLLTPFVAEVVELADDGLCCGAGGAYSLLEPALANEIRDRKLSAIAAVAPDVVASANPGCAMHLAATGLSVRHPVELVAEALRQPPEREDSAR